jgi:hypothetical protein
MNKSFLFLISFILLNTSFYSCTNKTHKDSKEIIVKYNSNNIEYSGRIDSLEKNHVKLYWSGTSIKINFEGKEVQALIKDENGKNYYNIILDNDSIIVFHPDTILQYYTLAKGLNKGKHSLEIFRRTEWSKGYTLFEGFKIIGNPKVLKKDKAKKYKIEFYGDSITAGYANEDPQAKDNPDSTNTNNYMSYSAITARNFDAKYSCIAKGGIGIMISWFDFTMPDIYDRLNPNNENSKWNFSLYQPDIVVINLFQNDSWLVNMPNRKEFKDKFNNTSPTDQYIINSYKEFVRKIRSKYPKANIICTLGSMSATKKGSPWPNYIKEAVEQMDDNKIKTCFFAYKNTKGHPVVSEHKIMANTLTKFISKQIGWESINK